MRWILITVVGSLAALALWPFVADFGKYIYKKYQELRGNFHALQEEQAKIEDKEDGRPEDKTD